MANSQRQGGNRGEDVVTQKQSYMAQAHQVTDNSRDATRRMVALVEESKAVGIDTIDELVRQGEQLDNIEANLDDIAIGVQKAEKNINEMNKCCGLFTLPWKRWKKFDRMAAFKDAFDENRVAKREKAALQEAEKAASAHMSASPKGAQPQTGPYVQRVMNDEREDEMEENLKHVGAGLEMLKGMAFDLGTTIDKQNVQIEHITAKGEANEIGLAQNQHKMDRMLKGT